MCILRVSAESQQSPSTTPQIKAQIKTDNTIKHQKPSDQTDKITNASPPIIPQIATKIENGVAKTNTENREEQGTEFWPSFFGLRLKITDSLLVLFTAILAIFTWCLHRSTHKLWKAGEDQMHITRDSLELAREEFISTHRPRLIHTHPMIPIEEGMPIQVEWCVVNVGATDAVIIESNATIFVGAKTFEARTPYSSDRDSMNGFTFIPGGAFTFTMSADQVDFHNPGQLHYLTLGEKVIYFFGFIMYRDNIHNVRRTAFFRRYDPNAERFIIVNEPDYEYAD